MHSQFSVRYMTFCGVVNASFGVYFEDWRTYHHSPLWFALPEKGLQGSVIYKLTREPFNAKPKDGYVYVPIHLHGGQYEVVLASLIGQIARIAESIK